MSPAKTCMFDQSALATAMRAMGNNGFMAAILATCLCLPWHSAEAQRNVTAADAATVSNAEIALGPVADNEDIRALLTARRQAELSSLVSARIKRIQFKEGESFNEGDVLISFECAVLKARLLSQLAKLKQYKLTLAANKELRKDGAVSRLALELSKAKVEEGSAEAALARAQLNKCTIRAPYAGRVEAVMVNEYENVNAGDPLITILDDGKLEMVLHLPSKWMSSVSKGKRFAVTIDETGKKYAAAIVRINPKIDPTSRTFNVIAEIVGRQTDLRAGMSGNAEFKPVP